MPDTISSVIEKLETDIAKCLQWLCENLESECTTTETHQLLTITGICRSPECLHELAVYCVGQIAKAVQVNLEIRADLLGKDDEDAYSQLINDVYSVIGEKSDTLNGVQKRDERDPWLFEALSHLLVHLSRKKKEFLPVGTLIGLTMTHKGVKEPGLDLVAIYASSAMGLAIGESKAWQDDPSGGLDSAAQKFTDVDLGSYDAELRTKVGEMRYAMPIEYQEQLTGAFWRDERAYLPFIGYDASHRPRWRSRRKNLVPLQVPQTHRILVPLPLDDFQSFFDNLSDAMREYLSSLRGQ